MEWIGHVCESSKEKDPTTQMIIFAKFFCESSKKVVRLKKDITEEDLMT